jgi:hypothetical protein
MENEFIPYEQALELKELGFDEPCFKGYTEEYKTLISFSSTNTNTSVKNALPTKPFTAPLYQQAFRWFREKHNLHGIVSYCGKNQWDIELLDYKGNQLVEIENNTFWTYEEAELACLIKLIEIIKNK